MTNTEKQGQVGQAGRGETKHTPGPWSIFEGDGATCAITGNERQLAQDRALCEHVALVDGKVNAELIVTAVNERAELLAQRDELLAALRATIRYVEGAYECAFPDERENESVAEQARAAIARAEKGGAK